MKNFNDFTKDGYNILACSSDGNFMVTSYIAKRRGRKIYGYFNHKKGEYVEQFI